MESYRFFSIFYIVVYSITSYEFSIKKAPVYDAHMV